MKKNVIKRNGEERLFDETKIENAIRKAAKEKTGGKPITEKQILKMVKGVAEECEKLNRAIPVEEIQDMVETKLMQEGEFEVAKKYITYRYKRSLLRKSNTTDARIISLVDCNNEEVKQENSNKNPTVAATQRDYIAGEVSKDICGRMILPKDVVQAHKDGIIHFHDMDYFLQRIFNCCLINIEDMLQNGTVIAGNKIDTPKSFLTACTIATQISAAVASNQYGGQTITLTHLAPFIDVSRRKIRKSMEEDGITAKMSKEEVDEIVEKAVRREVKAGVQTIQYQVSTIATSNGQAPFITLFMYLNEAKDEQTKKDLAMLIEEVLNQRILGVKNEVGVYVAPAFPKLIYVLEEDNVKEGTPYWYLTKLAAECTAKRMVPDYISEKKMMEYKKDVDGDGYCYPCMGCRSFLTVPRGDVEKGKFYGRFNQGVVTINLVDVALSAEKDMGRFWQILEERCELCHKALRCRHERLLGTLSDTSPIHWQYGAIARLKKGETIDKLLYGGYSTISLGYAGLWECVVALNGKKLTESDGEKLGLKIMQKLNDFTAKWKKAENIDYSLYGTPLESTTYKFAKCLQKRFGIIKDVTDKEYITNSYHVHVTEKMTAFDKLALEAKFQRLSPGGAISYVEVPNMQGNIQAVLSIMQFMYDNIQYSELNTKIDYCQICGFSGEIKVVNDENGKLVWECPNCHNRDQSKMNVVRRTCGYLGSQFWNQGRTEEIRDRVLHVD